MNAPVKRLATKADCEAGTAPRMPSFGGFLGIGESYHPLPWRILSYDTALGGYVVDLDRRRLEGAPTYTTAEEPDWRTYPERIDAYCPIPPV